MNCFENLTFGVLLVLIFSFTAYYLPTLLGYVEVNRPIIFNLATVLGIRFFVSGLLSLFVGCIANGLMASCSRCA